LTTIYIDLSPTAGITDFTGYQPAAREEDLDLDFFLPDAPLLARAQGAGN
jgi:hypothetical protein